MPPNLHPRSTHTTTLFATTLLISFLVVGVPHLLPCPVSKRQLLDAPIVEVRDENGRRVYKRVYRKPNAQLSRDGKAPTEMDSAAFEADTRHERECPVPKPGGFVGRWLGFQSGERRSEGEGRSVVKIGQDDTEEARSGDDEP